MNEKRNGPSGSDQTVCPSSRTNVLGFAKNNRGSSAWPADFAKRHLGANYREAYRARSKAEFISKCGESLRELEETAYWIELLVDGNIVPATRLADLGIECEELTAIFVTILKKAKRPS